MIQLSLTLNLIFRVSECVAQTGVLFIVYYILCVDISVIKP